MGVDLLDIKFRLERDFGVSITHDEWIKLAARNDPPDVLVGDLFDIIRRSASQTGVLDEEIDGEGILWLHFQQAISEALGVETEEVLKDRGIIYDLGAC